MYSAVTHHSLRYTDVVSWGLGRGLIWASGVTEDTQLLGPLNTTFAKTSNLDPISTGYLVSFDHEVVTFA